SGKEKEPIVIPTFILQPMRISHAHLWNSDTGDVGITKCLVSGLETFFKKRNQFLELKTWVKKTVSGRFYRLHEGN
ncbi:hypothetical protein ACQP3F_30450, partial [Escherichia coli]